MENLSKETLITSNCHTMSVTQFEGKYYAYVGFVDFSGIDLYSGTRMDRLKLQQNIFNKNRRWAVNYFDQITGINHLFCTSSNDTTGKTYDLQDIHYYIAPNFTDLSYQGICIKNASAPFIFNHEDNFYLFYHRINETSHEICVRKSESISSLSEAEEIKLIVLPKGRNKCIISSPSVIYKANEKKFYMMTEYKDNSLNDWVTKLFTSDDVTENYQIADDDVLGSGCACAFQYKFKNGMNYVIYSRHASGLRWDMYIRKMEK